MGHYIDSFKLLKDLTMKKILLAALLVAAVSEVRASQEGKYLLGTVSFCAACYGVGSILWDTYKEWPLVETRQTKIKKVHYYLKAGSGLFLSAVIIQAVAFPVSKP